MKINVSIIIICLKRIKSPLIAGIILRLYVTSLNRKKSIFYRNASKVLEKLEQNVSLMLLVIVFVFLYKYTKENIKFTKKMRNTHNYLKLHETVR